MISAKGITFENQKRYKIDKRRAEALYLFAYISHYPGLTRKDLARECGYTISRITQLISYLKEHTDLILEKPNLTGKRRFTYYLKWPLSRQGADFIHFDPQFRKVVDVAAASGKLNAAHE